MFKRFRKEQVNFMQVVEYKRSYRIDIYNELGQVGSVVHVLKTGKINRCVYDLSELHNVNRNNIRCFDQNLKLITGGV